MFPTTYAVPEYGSEGRTVQRCVGEFFVAVIPVTIRPVTTEVKEIEKIREGYIISNTDI